MDDAIKATPEGQEIDRIYNDESHPMHAGFVAGDRKVSEHVSRLYEQGFKNTSSNSAPVAASEVLKAQAEIDRVYNDPAHPLHEKYKAGDKDAIEKVGQLHQQAYGGRPVDQDEQRSMVPETLNEEGRMSIDILKREWGANFSTNYLSAMDAIGALPAQKAEPVLDDYRGLANDPAIIGVLSSIGRGAWDKISPATLERIEKTYPGIGEDIRVQELVEELKNHFGKRG